jgi:hypothetical protein
MSAIVGTGVLAQDTGESPRTLQHWSDLGILQPLAETHKKGRGYHREFPAPAPYYGERTWALIASAMNEIRIPLGDIKRFVDALRPVIDRQAVRAAAHDDPARQIRTMFNNPIGRALTGRLEIILLAMGSSGKLDWASIVSEESPEAVRQPYTLRMGLGDDAERVEMFEQVAMSAPADFLSDHRASYVLNLTRILEPLRTPAR